MIAWMSSPRPGTEHDHGRVGRAHDVDLVLADADGLDDARVEAGGVEQRRPRRGRARQAPEGAAGRHASG